MKFVKGDRVVYTGKEKDWAKYYGRPSVVHSVDNNGSVSTTFDNPVNEIDGIFVNSKDLTHENIFKSKLHKALK